MKKSLALGLCVTSLITSINAYSLPDFILNLITPKSYAACKKADPVEFPSFCSTFKAVAACHCSGSLPSGMCQDMKTIYSRMVSIFGSQQKACEYQWGDGKKDGGVPVQECMDDWNCYRQGGTSSENKVCSGTGNACERFL